MPSFFICIFPEIDFLRGNNFQIHKEKGKFGIFGVKMEAKSVVYFSQFIKMEEDGKISLLANCKKLVKQVSFLCNLTVAKGKIC